MPDPAMAWLVSMSSSTQGPGKGLAADEVEQQVARQVGDFAMVVLELTTSPSQAAHKNI